MKRGDEIRKYWENPDTVSLRDDNLRRLEVDEISAWLEPGDRALDLGCGDGINTVEYARRVHHILGVDYSASMIDKASRRVGNTSLDGIRFQQLDAGALEAFDASFDVVITQRCLINMVELSDQVEALRSIHRLLKTGGRYLMLECFEDGRASLNELRRRMGLKPIPLPWHNRFFQHEELDRAVAGLFAVKATIDFSLYFLLSRVFAPSMGVMPTDPTCERMDEVARQMTRSLGLDSLVGIGPQRLSILVKFGGQ